MTRRRPTMADPVYSITVCNYNMAETLDRSIQSIAEQVPPETYEVVVVDGGSTDGSQDVLRVLAKEYPHVRAVLDRTDEAQHLGGDRNISFEEAKGTYVLESLDTDDYYRHGVIQDFVRIYRAIERGREDPFYLSGTGMNMAPRDLYLEVPFRDVGGAEDRDVWRRLIDREQLVWLDHGPVGGQIGYAKDPMWALSRDFEEKVCEFRTGVSLASALRYALTSPTDRTFERDRPLHTLVPKRLYDLVTLPLAYLQARSRGPFDPEAGPYEKALLDRWIADNARTLPALEADYGVSVDREELSTGGRFVFCPEYWPDD